MSVDVAGFGVGGWLASDRRCSASCRVVVGAPAVAAVVVAVVVLVLLWSPWL